MSTKKAPAGGVPLPGMQKRETASTAEAMSSVPAVRKFDGKNFSMWKVQMRAYLTLKNLHIALSPKPVLTNDSDREGKQQLIEEWHTKSAMARAIILLALEDDQGVLVANLATAHEMWMRLSQAYESSSRASRVVLQRQFFDAHMKEGENVVDYIGRVQKIFTQLIQSGVKIEEETLVARIVAGLTSSYQSFQSMWGNDTLTPQTLSSLLPRLTAEEHLIGRNKKPAGAALLSTTNKQNNGKGKGGKPKGKTQNKNSGQKKDKKDVTCFNCQEKGHYKNQCKNPTKPRDKEGEGAVASSCIAEANLSQDNEKWILDSGATQHMTYDDSCFINKRELDSKKIIRGFDGGKAYGIAVGDIKVISKIGNETKTLIMHNVLHVPAMRRKLFSLSYTATKGNVANISEEMIHVIDSNQNVILIGTKEQGLYVASIEEIESDGTQHNQAMVSNEIQQDKDLKCSNLKLWHERFCHVGKSTIGKMKKREAVIGLEDCNITEDAKADDRKIISCDACVLGKQSRISFPESSRERATEVGARLHVDICGPISTPTLVGSRYVVLFKDEFSNYRHVYFAKAKGEAFEFTKICIAQIEADTGKKTLCLVSDHGSEFTSNKMKDFVMEKGIVQSFSAPFTPQQNGFIERDNRTMMEATRTMLFHSKLPEKLWGEATNTAIYTLNRVLNANNKDRTPYELYFGRKPRVSLLVKLKERWKNKLRLENRL